MKTLKQIAEDLVLMLMTNKDVINLSVYKSPDTFWEYYYCISGTIGASKFNVYLNRSINDNKDTIEISRVGTDRESMIGEVLLDIEPKAKITIN